MQQLYVVLGRTSSEDMDSENLEISTYLSFETLRANGIIYDTNREVLIFKTTDQIFNNLDGLENFEYDTAEMILMALLGEPVTFDSIINDKYTHLEEQIKVLTAENNLLKEQLANWKDDGLQVS